VSTSIVKCSEGLSNRLSVIIRRYIDQIKSLLVWLSGLSFFFHIPLALFYIIVYMVVCFVCFCLIL
jgi:hypothetical protein